MKLERLERKINSLYMGSMEVRVRGTFLEEEIEGFMKSRKVLREKGFGKAIF